MTGPQLEDVWRRESSHVLAALLRRHGDYADCEDAAQDAVAAAAEQWPRDGVPDNPRGWLIRVASRRLVDQVRSNRSRAVRERTVGTAHPADAYLGPAADGRLSPNGDDTLLLLLLCCHPQLSRPSQVALTLRAVSGLPTRAIATAFLVPESTMAQRLSRARNILRNNAVRFDKPTPEELPVRVAAVLDVLYLIFNEGYARSAGDTLLDTSLADEAIRLTRQLHAYLPDHDEVTGALALMLLTDARRAARTDERGDLMPLAEQDRSRWNAALIREGVALLEEVLPRGHVGAYQLQAAIAAVHAEAEHYENTDWAQIAVLYSMLDHVAPSPAVTLNRGVAIGMSAGPTAGLAALQPLVDDASLERYHRLPAVRAHLLEMAGDLVEAERQYARAAELTSSRPEQRYLARRLTRLRERGAMGQLEDDGRPETGRAGSR
jgi:RNA polymerase sigma factor (sigma-70 family)